MNSTLSKRSPKTVVNNVVRTGRFRLRPGKWWESMFVVEIEELISYADMQTSLTIDQTNVWRKAGKLDMFNVPGEMFDPRSMILQEDIDAAVIRSGGVW